ncbi:Integrin-linked protein kinase 1 [Camellia lanceoleosa]|uniref:Integrin-linked protein kinase 1 n=1 Tax=Camellia lanceoleosa TaxID=1840588 RepID=A0ACC0IEI2_9ERIC|nr:Integrin-linked protein kinase 1 [Camellia lanceoleosa]
MKVSGFSLISLFKVSPDTTKLLQPDTQIACSSLYVAPEVYKNEIFDRSVDAYSFGLILYEITRPVIDHGCADRGDVDATFAGGVEPVDDGWKDNFEEGFSCRTNDLDAANQKFLVIRREGGVCGVEQRNGDGKVESLTEEYIQMTPPDAGLSSDPNLKENSGNEDRNCDSSGRPYL